MERTGNFDNDFSGNADDKQSLSALHLRSELDEFRQSMNEWIMFLNRHMKETRQAVIELENKVAEIERNFRTRI